MSELITISQCADISGQAIGLLLGQFFSIIVTAFIIFWVLKLLIKHSRYDKCCSCSVKS